MKPLTVILGKNSTGKTSLLKLISFISENNYASKFGPEPVSVTSDRCRIESPISIFPYHDKDKEVVLSFDLHSLPVSPILTTTLEFLEETLNQIQNLNLTFERADFKEDFRSRSVVRQSFNLRLMIEELRKQHEGDGIVLGDAVDVINRVRKYVSETTRGIRSFNVRSINSITKSEINRAYLDRRTRLLDEVIDADLLARVTFLLNLLRGIPEGHQTMQANLEIYLRYDETAIGYLSINKYIFKIPKLSVTARLTHPMGDRNKALCKWFVPISFAGQESSWSSESSDFLPYTKDFWLISREVNLPENAHPSFIVFSKLLEQASRSIDRSLSPRKFTDIRAARMEPRDVYSHESGVKSETETIEDLKMNFGSNKSRYRKSVSKLPQHWLAFKQEFGYFPQISEVSHRSTGLALKNPRGRPKFTLGLEDVGYGLSQFLPLVYAVGRIEKSGFISMEQPEAHMHASSLTSLVGSIDNVYKKFHFDNDSDQSCDEFPILLIETHSEHLLNCILAVLGSQEKWRKNISFLYFFKNQKELGGCSMRSSVFGCSSFFEAPLDYFHDFTSIETKAISVIVKERDRITSEEPRKSSD